MNAFILSLVAFIFLIDQLSKYLILQILQPNKSIEIVKNVFYLTLVHNTGAAFGIFKNQTAFFITITAITIIVIFIYIGKRSGKFTMVDASLAFILGGALGNLVDRLRFGHVIDFLDFRIWPVFNLGDSAITIGVVLLLIALAGKNTSLSDRK